MTVGPSATTAREKLTSPLRDRLMSLATANIADIAREFGTPETGLTSEDAARRLQGYGPNALQPARNAALGILARQLLNPLLGLLLAATVVSLVVGERADAVIILSIVLLSVLLGFFDEYRADVAVRALESRLTQTANVVRDGAVTRVSAAEVVPGDILVLGVGDICVADARLTSSTDLTTDESVLSGESFPVEKTAIADHDDAASLATVVLSGSSIRSGRGMAIAVSTGPRTLFGQLATQVQAPQRTTEFQRGMRRFSLFLVGVTAVLTAFIFLANTLLDHGVLDALLFSLAIAVGLTPQLLPAIVTVSLSLGARRLANDRVIVRHLVAIEDLGNIETLFSDKTGTLTQGTVTLEATVGGNGKEDPRVMEWASSWLSAGAHPLVTNVLDATLAADARAVEMARARDGWAVLDELPFSYQRRSAALLIQDPNGSHYIVVKGAAEEILVACRSASMWGPDWRARIQRALDQLLHEGARTLGVAVKPVAGNTLSPADLTELDFIGFLAFSDPVKMESKAALAQLRALNVDVKILTGDHPAVAKRVCEQLELRFAGAITGAELAALEGDALSDAIERNTVFARVTPEQKAQVVAAVQRRGRDVGFLGDGVNDAPALRQADVGISVDDATDVAKAAADVVLLEKDLQVLAAGIAEGRRTFANTVKYVMMATSSNFGNMFSAAGASLFLSFLPMLPTQILANNFLYDVSELSLPTDRVDEELTRRPAHWDVRLIFRFMVVFGTASSLYDFLTFALMLNVFQAGESLFQSGWFVESFCTQTLVIFLLRTQRVPFWKSAPSRWLTVTTLICVAIAVCLPFSPLADPLGFQALPVRFFLALVGLVVTYLLIVEVAKRSFFRRWPSMTGQIGLAKSASIAT